MSKTQRVGRKGESRFIHGESRPMTAEYLVWKNIKARCYNPNHPQYKDYGGRGILMHPEWREDYESFRNYVGRKPVPEFTIERVDNDKGYVPGNVTWASRADQAINRRPKSGVKSRTKPRRLYVAPGVLLHPDY